MQRGLALITPVNETRYNVLWVITRSVISRYNEYIDVRDTAEDAAVALITCIKRHV